MATETEIATRKHDLEAVHGPWTAHNIRLADGVFTMDAAPQGDEVKLRRVVQIAADLARKPFAELRVLDLACLEGMYALEFAARGARVTAIEGREQNLAKARFAGETLGLDVEWILGDVRDLDRERHGTFDVVLCLGILYHLDADDVVSLVRKMHDACTDLLILDTSLAPAARVRHGAYWGDELFEHDPASSPEQRLEAVWSSLDNPSAFVPTRSSMLNLLADTGFTSVFECKLPPEPQKPVDRVTLVARAGERVSPLLTPPVGDWERIGESAEERSRPLAQRLPAPVKAALRRALRRPQPVRR